MSILGMILTLVVIAVLWFAYEMLTTRGKITDEEAKRMYLENSVKKNNRDAT